jgi:hypothetical protein
VAVRFAITILGALAVVATGQLRPAWSAAWPEVASYGERIVATEQNARDSRSAVGGNNARRARRAGVQEDSPDFFRYFWMPRVPFARHGAT